MFFVFIFIACSVQNLSIQVPPQGIDAIQQEDFRRDIWALQQNQKSIEEWLDIRAEQLNLEPQFKGKTTCFSRIGENDTGVAFWTKNESEYKYIAISVLFSLAKITDTKKNPIGLLYCIGKPPIFSLGWKQVEIADITGTSLKEIDGTWVSSSEGRFNFVDVQFEQLVANTKEIARQTIPFVVLGSVAN
jgi:hypothetical protein